MKINFLRIFQILILLASVGLFAASLPQPAFYTQSGSWNGLLCLLFGWLAVPDFAGAFSWLANPCLGFVWLLRLKEMWLTDEEMRLLGVQKNRIIPALGVFVLSLATVLLCLAFPFLFDTIIRNEAGGTEKITGLGLGFFLWLFSAAVMFAGCSIQLLYELFRQEDNVSVQQNDVPVPITALPPVFQ